MMTKVGSWKRRKEAIIMGALEVYLETLENLRTESEFD